MSDGNQQDDSSDMSTFRVEVGKTETGVAYVEAHNEDHARQKAKSDADSGDVDLSTADVFTNNVRTISAEDE